MTKMVLFDWESDAPVEERCQCAATALVLMNQGDPNLNGLCDSTSSSSIRCSVMCTNDTQCSFELCDTTQMNEELCLLRNKMMPSVQVEDEVVPLVYITRGVQCNVIRDFSDAICAVLFSDDSNNSDDSVPGESCKV